MAAKNFDFDVYNGLLKNANTGLRLHLAVQLTKDVLDSLERFDNPLEQELRGTYSSLLTFRHKYKAAAKERAEKAANESERTASVDNRTVPVVGVQDMMQMFQLFKQMMSAENAGTALPDAAERGIREVQAGVLHQQGDKTGTNG